MAKSDYNTYKGNALNVIGNVYLVKGNFAEAMQSFEKSLDAYKVYNNKTGIPNTFIYLAELFKALGKIDSSIFKNLWVSSLQFIFKFTQF